MGSCAPKQCIARRAGEIERRGQRAHGFDVRPLPFTALERADGMHGKARDRGELLLGEAGGLTQRLEMRSE
jgi:hypothetical protein